jgi:hypothetical protein
MADPKFADVVPVALVMGGSVSYAIQQASTGNFYDGAAFAAVAGVTPPTFPLPEVPGVPGYRRADVPTPPAVFTPDVYYIIYISTIDSTGATVPPYAFGFDQWDLRDPAWNPTPARFAGWLQTYDPIARSWSSKYVDGPK